MRLMLTHVTAGIVGTETALVWPGRFTPSSHHNLSWRPTALADLQGASNSKDRQASCRIRLVSRQ